MTLPRRARRLLLAAAFGAGVACAAPAIAPSAPEGERAPLIVVGDEDYPPYLFRDEDGRATGLVADEWALWSAKTGVRVSLQPMSWAEAQRQIADGRADVIDTIFRSPARERELDFGSPYADIPATIYAANEIGAVTDL